MNSRSFERSVSSGSLKRSTGHRVTLALPGEYHVSIGVIPSQCKNPTPFENPRKTSSSGFILPVTYEEGIEPTEARQYDEANTLQNILDAPVKNILSSEEQSDHKKANRLDRSDNGTPRTTRYKRIVKRCKCRCVGLSKPTVPLRALRKLIANNDDTPNLRVATIEKPSDGLVSTSVLRSVITKHSYLSRYRRRT